MRLTRGTTIAIATATLLLALAAPAPAATEAEVLAAIDDGIAWLVANQNGNGSWPGGFGHTALACKKLMHFATDTERGLGLPTPFHPDYPFLDQLESCLDWLLAQGATTAIGVQPAGDPDTNGNNLGVFFPGQVYEQGIMLMLLCEAVELERVVTSGPLAGSTYRFVAEDLAEYLYYCQNDGANPGPRGGWRYGCNYGDSDNSVTGWVTVGLAYAEAPELPVPLGCGFTIPTWVKDELELWSDYIQSGDGCSDYDIPTRGFGNILKSGNLIEQYSILGDDASSPRVQSAIDCICTHFDDPNDGWPGGNYGWSGGGGIASYQATFAAMKGLISFGDDLDLICDPAIDWGFEFDDEIVAEQNVDGSWSGCEWGDAVLCTSWALLTLERAAPPQVFTCDDIRDFVIQIRTTDVGEFVFSSYRVIMGYIAAAAARNCDIGDYRDVVTLLGRIIERTDGASPPSDWMIAGAARDAIHDRAVALRRFFQSLLP